MPFAMTLTELLIIYLACGSPFFVNSMVRSAKVSNAWLISSAAAAMLAWPFFAAADLIRVKGAPLVSPYYSFHTRQLDSTSRNTAEEPRRRLVSLWDFRFGERGLFAFQETIDRYIEMAFQVSEASLSRSLTTTPEILVISKHSDIAAGRACLARRETKVLGFHLSRSRRDMIDQVIKLDDGNNSALEAATKLAICIDDDETVSALTSIKADELTTRGRSTFAHRA